MEGVNDKWEKHHAMTAVGLLTKIFVEKRKTSDMAVQAAILLKELPTWNEEKKTIDYYYWYYAALAIFQYDAPNGPAWKAFNPEMKKCLVLHQSGFKASGGYSTSNCEDGSWNPVVDKWGTIGGRVYATAINVLTLEVYYRYANVFTGNERKAGEKK
jgi:hypothetical protein